MQKQIELLTRMVEERRPDGGAVDHRDQVKLTKFGEGDDIEFYLTTFERMMGAYDMPRDGYLNWLLTLRERPSRSKNQIKWRLQS